MAETKHILVPMASVRNIPTILRELFARFQASLYADPRDAAFKARGESTGANGITAYGHYGSDSNAKGGKGFGGNLALRIPHRRLYFPAHYAADKMKSMGKMGQTQQSPWMIWRLAVPGQERCSSDSTHNGRRTGCHLSMKELP